MPLIADVHLDVGDSRTSVEVFQSALEVRRDIGDALGAAEVLGKLEIAYERQGQTRKAAKCYEEGLGVAHQAGNDEAAAKHSWHMGQIYVDSDPAGAAELMQVCVDYEREIGHPDAEKDAEWLRQVRAGIAEHET